MEPLARESRLFLLLRRGGRARYASVPPLTGGSARCSCTRGLLLGTFARGAVPGGGVVGVRRFELRASSSRTTRSTKLSYTPRTARLRVERAMLQRPRGLCREVRCWGSVLRTLPQLAESPRREIYMVISGHELTRSG